MTLIAPEGWHIGLAMRKGCIPTPALYPIVRAFRYSPYGINSDATHMVPYLINSDLTIDYRGDLAIAASFGAETVMLDDATMVTTVEISSTSSGLAVVSRSGSAIAMGSAQATVATGNSGAVGLVRIDANTIARGYPQTGPDGGGGVIELLSVSGSSISSLGTTVFASTFTPTSGGTPTMLGSTVSDLHHSDGSGWLIGHASDTGFSGARRQMVYAFSGGSVTASYRVALPSDDSYAEDTGTEGSTEVVYIGPGGSYVGFYWDGSAGHFGSAGLSSLENTFAGGRFAGGDGNETGAYLNLSAIPKLVTQSGSSLTAAAVAPSYLCPVGVTYGDGSSDGAYQSSARHGPENLAVANHVLHSGPSGWVLKALSW